jgi:hypothetical protein
VSAVCAAALLGGLVDLDVLDNQVASVETLGIGVGLGVLEQAEEELSRLDGPAGTGDTEGLACCSTPHQHASFYRFVSRSPSSQFLVLFAEVDSANHWWCCRRVEAPCCHVPLLRRAVNIEFPSSTPHPSNPRKRCKSRTLGGAANGTAVAAHGNGLALGHDVLEELDRALKLPAVDGLSGLASVLERNTEVGTAGAGRLGRLDLSRSVSDLVIEEKEKCQLLLSQNLTARSSRVSPNNIPKGRQSQIFNTDSIVSQ